MSVVDIAWCAASLLLALVAGKFIAIASLRMPRGEDIVWANNPSGQRARDAKLLVACVAIAAWAVAVHPGPLGAVTSVLGWWLLLIAVIDWEHFWLPDRLTIPLGLFGLIAAAFINPVRWSDHLIGTAVGFLVLSALALLYKRLRGREGMGGGDPRLLAAGGAWLGWIGLPSVLLWASAGGLAIAGLNALRGRPIGATDRVAFGTYLALGIWLTWLYGPLGGSS